MSNFSNLKTEPMLFCSRHWEGEHFLPRIYICYAIFYVVLSITATLGNILILVALHRDTSLHPPSKLLLRSLTITDLCAGFISQPVAITLLLSAVNESWFLCRIAKYSSYVLTTIFSGISFETLTAISVDRLLALITGIQYRQVVTVQRVRVVVLLSWLQNSAVGFLYLWNRTSYFITIFVLIMLGVIISTYSYTRIFRTIRRQQTQVLDDTLGGERAGTSPNMARYKKTVRNALWVHLTLAVCYLPLAIVTVIIVIRGLNSSVFVAEGTAVSLVFLNSSLNPVLYCWKIMEIRRAVRETMRQFGACLAT